MTALLDLAHILSRVSFSSGYDAGTFLAVALLLTPPAVIIGGILFTRPVRF